MKDLEDSDDSEFDLLEEVVAPRSTVDTNSNQGDLLVATTQASQQVEATLTKKLDSKPKDAKAATTRRVEASNVVSGGKIRSAGRRVLATGSEGKLRSTGRRAQVQEQVHESPVTDEGVPGAYAVANPDLSSTEMTHRSNTEVAMGGDHHRSYSEVDSDSSGPEDDNISSHTNDEESDVPVANPVAGEEGLPRAQAHQQQEHKTTATKRNMLLAVIAVLLLAMILIAVLVPTTTKNNNKASHTTSTPAESNKTTHTEAPVFVLNTEDYLLSLLPQETIAIIQQDSQNSSPQSKAFQWLVSDTTNGDDPLPANRLQQRFALATLYHATSGDFWLNNEYWLDHNVHECDWYYTPDYAIHSMLSNFIQGYIQGLFPPGEPYPPLRCDVKGNYHHLWLAQNSLQGNVPDEVYELMPTLRTIGLALNAMEGTISTRIGNLKHLEGFFLYGHQKAGTIPSQMGLLTNMKVLGLLQVDLEGQIPSQLWQLTNLETISLNWNPNLSGTIPADKIASFSTLRHALFHNTNLSGTIPTQIGLATSLEWLVFIENTMTGTMPTQLGLLPKLRNVDISTTSISGTIPTQIGAWTDVHTLHLVNNQLSGSIPPQIESLTNLKLSMDLHGNKLTGTIPTTLGLFTSLQDLALRNNQLTGPIPSQLALLPALESLSLTNNTLSGPVPTQLAQMQHTLYMLQLEGNPILSGTIPEGLCSLSGQCTEDPVNPCEGSLGLTFDCSTMLCGCSCPCLN